MQMDKIRIHYSFYGRVQGVGFRYRAAHAAQLYGLTGTVLGRFCGAGASGGQDIYRESPGDPVRLPVHLHRTDGKRRTSSYRGPRMTEILC